MFNLKHWLNLATNPQDYIWIEAVLIKETPKAILIEFDGKKTWLPKAWIKAITKIPSPQRGEGKGEGDDLPSPNPISIKISQYHWAKKFQ